MREHLSFFCASTYHWKQRSRGLGTFEWGNKMVVRCLTPLLPGAPLCGWLCSLLRQFSKREMWVSSLWSPNEQPQPFVFLVNMPKRRRKNRERVERPKYFITRRKGLGTFVPLWIGEHWRVKWVDGVGERQQVGWAKSASGSGVLWGGADTSWVLSSMQDSISACISGMKTTEKSMLFVLKQRIPRMKRWRGMSLFKFFFPFWLAEEKNRNS